MTGDPLHLAASHRFHLPPRLHHTARMNGNTPAFVLPVGCCCRETNGKPSCCLSDGGDNNEALIPPYAPALFCFVLHAASCITGERTSCALCGLTRLSGESLLTEATHTWWNHKHGSPVVGPTAVTRKERNSYRIPLKTQPAATHPSIHPSMHRSFLVI